MRTSEQINELAAALAAAQGAIHGAVKSSSNPFFKSRYADLASCLEAIREPMSTNGLAVIQTPSCNNGSVILTTRLCHSSGQWVEDTLTMELEKSGPQAIGSVITYARRYALAAIVGLAQVDDDANGGGVTADPGQWVDQKEKSKPASQPPWRMTTALLESLKAGWYHPRKLDLADMSQDTMRGLFSEWVLDATGLPYPASMKDWTQQAYDSCLEKLETEAAGRLQDAARSEDRPQ
jgi:hypothetical protein